MIVKKKIIYSLILFLSFGLTTIFSMCSCESGENRYFQIQSKVIQASIARDFDSIRAGSDIYFPEYLSEAFTGPWIIHPGLKWVDSYHFFREWLSLEDAVTLVQSESGYEAHDLRSGENLDILGHKDWKTIRALVQDCNVLLERKGRLACEFDGGYDLSKTPLTTMLFNIAYLKYQSEGLAYQGGRYGLAEDLKSERPLDVYDLLRRNAIVRIICARILTKTTSLLIHREESRLSANSSLAKNLTYKELNNYYYNGWEYHWRGFLEANLGTDIEFSETDFMTRKPGTGGRIAFPQEEDLVITTLKELNYYHDKINFSEDFMLTNYPMFLLSILRLYDVNLDWDESGKYIIVPGPTNPERFFKMVAECTFVNDPSDTEYLKEHLTSWLEPK